MDHRSALRHSVPDSKGVFVIESSRSKTTRCGMQRVRHGPHYRNTCTAAGFLLLWRPQRCFASRRNRERPIFLSGTPLKKWKYSTIVVAGSRTLTFFVWPTTKNLVIRDTQSSPRSKTTRHGKPSLYRNTDTGLAFSMRHRLLYDTIRQQFTRRYWRGVCNPKTVV